MTRLEIDHSRPRQAAAWIGEKLAQLKLVIDDSAAGNMRLFEGVEAVSLGIEGKTGLWRALEACAATSPALQLDYPRLIVRSQEQRSVAETLRLQMALAALQA